MSTIVINTIIWCCFKYAVHCSRATPHGHWTTQNNLYDVKKEVNKTDNSFERTKMATISHSLACSCVFFLISCYTFHYLWRVNFNLQNPSHCHVHGRRGTEMERCVLFSILKNLKKKKLQQSSTEKCKMKRSFKNEEPYKLNWNVCIMFSEWFCSQMLILYPA